MKRLVKYALLLLVLALAGPAQTACCTAGGCASLGIGQVLGDAMIESVSRSTAEGSEHQSPSKPSPSTEAPR